MSPIERFWLGVRKGAPDECWPYIGTYQLQWGGRMQSKRRVAWIVTNGQVPEGQMVIARCDNGACCNPSHSFLGDRKDEGTRRVERGRSTSGVKNIHAKLTEDQVREVKKRYRKTGPNSGNGSELARELGVKPGTIHAIGRGHTWKHVQ